MTQLYHHTIVLAQSNNQTMPTQSETLPTFVKQKDDRYEFTHSYHDGVGSTRNIAEKIIGEISLDPEKRDPNTVQEIKAYYQNKIDSMVDEKDIALMQGPIDFINTLKK